MSFPTVTRYGRDPLDDLELANKAYVDIGGLGGWGQLGQVVVTSDVDVLLLTIVARRYLRILLHKIPTGNVSTLLTFNGDTGANYAKNSVAEGAASALTTDATSIDLTTNSSTADELACDLFVTNITNSNKTVSGIIIGTQAQGSAVAPEQSSITAKWNDNAQITTVTVTNGEAGSYTAGTVLTVLGRD